jgi:hypothetical protein
MGVQTTAMKYPRFDYEPVTDTLSVQLSADVIEASIEPAPGVVISVDVNQRPVLIEFVGPVRDWFAPFLHQLRKDAEAAQQR